VTALLRRIVADAVSAADRVTPDESARAEHVLREAERVLAVGMRDPRVLKLSQATAFLSALSVAAVAVAATSLADTHLASGTHPAVAVYPVIRQSADVDIATRLRGLIVGYEVCGRIGELLRTADPTLRMTSLAGCAGAAAAASVLRGAGVDEAATAAGFALQGANGRNQWTLAGTDDEIAHAPLAAESAMVAARLAAAGLTAAPDILEGLWGFRASASPDVGARPLVIAQLFYKRFSACLFAQAPAELAAEAAAGSIRDASGDISGPWANRPTARPETIVVRVSPFVFEYPGCARVPRAGDVQARIMSVPFTVAGALSGAFAADGRFDPRRSAEVEDLARRVLVRPDARLNNLECELLLNGEASARSAPQGRELPLLYGDRHVASR
jgi:2-methylcitrate dehydratase PrpD